jgi:hypothetical protein
VPPALDLFFVDLLVSLTVPGNHVVRIYQSYVIATYPRRPINYDYGCTRVRPCVRPRLSKREHVEQVGTSTNDFSKRPGTCSLARTTLITKSLLPQSPNRYTMCSKMKTQHPDDHAEDGSQQHRALFQKARDHLNPGPFFRFVTYFYAERKIAVFLLIHAVCTLVVWGKLHNHDHLDLLNQIRV